MKTLDHLATLAVVLWVGALWAIGFIAAPSLFAHLEDRQLAGALAGRMFTVIAYLGMGCGVYLLLHRLFRAGGAAFKQAFFWIALAMLALTLVGHFGVQPVLAALRLEGGAREVMQSVVANRFSRWHGVASALYVFQSLLGVALVLKQPR